MATLSIRSNKTPTQIWSESVVYGRRPASEIERETAFRYLINNNGWTLAEYIAWINRPEPGVIKGELMAAPKWAAYGITTAAELGEYLDACHEREMEKASW